MKLGLKKKERTEHLNFRIEASLKQELTELFKECAAKDIDTTAALTVGLRQVAKALRRELDEVSDANIDAKTGANPGAKKRVLPAAQPALPNGSNTDRA
jgi:hypothetical protein